MIETIAIYYTPLASTKVAAAIGLGLAYHAALVYTNATGQSFGVSSGPSIQKAVQTPVSALTAFIAATGNTPSSFGTLVSDPMNNHAFTKGRPEDYYTQDDMGVEYPHVDAIQGQNLSAQWMSIVRTYAVVGERHLTYSPVSQNSNSLAGSALRKAGIPIPFSSATPFAPALFTDVLNGAEDYGPSSHRPPSPSASWTDPTIGLESNKAEPLATNCESFR